jgi:alpha/beta superfamily hydrolase
MERLVEFANRSGRRLRGMIHQPGESFSGRPAGVVFFHGFTGDRMESHWLFVKCSRDLERAGIASLRFDFFGSGESEGEFREATLEGEVADAQDAVDFFRREGGIDGERLGLLGLSLGGGIAALVAEQVRARALVLWAAVARLPHLRSLAAALLQPLPNNHAAHEYAGHEVSPRFLDAADSLDPLAALVRFTRPTLIVHPELDEHLNLTHPEDYFRASGAAVKEKVIIAGAGHTFDSVAWEREVIGRAVEWFQQHLAPAQASRT